MYGGTCPGAGWLPCTGQGMAWYGMVDVCDGYLAAEGNAFVLSSIIDTGRYGTLWEHQRYRQMSVRSQQNLARPTGMRMPHAQAAQASPVPAQASPGP